MKRHLLNTRKAAMRVFLLLSVYCLHLVFFQAAMASDCSAAKYFKTYLSHKADQKKGKPSPANFYIKFIKHANHSERPTVSFPTDILSNLIQAYLPQIVSDQPPVSKWVVYAHLPEDAFKLFQRIRVILL